jgi:hypothetical protein
MDAICSSETSVDPQRTARSYIPEDGTLHNHSCENINFYKSLGTLEGTTRPEVILDLKMVGNDTRKEPCRFSALPSYCVKWVGVFISSEIRDL